MDENKIFKLTNIVVFVLLFIATCCIGVAGLGFIVREVLSGYKAPVSVDTPPLASLPRDQWPEHGLDAVERYLSWGQCGECGFPVTDEDITNGYGDAQVFYIRGQHRKPATRWKIFVCYRHVSAEIVLPQKYKKKI